MVNTYQSLLCNDDVIPKSKVIMVSNMNLNNP